MKRDSRFKTQPENTSTARMTLDGETVTAQAGTSVAAAIIAHSGDASRITGKGAARTPFCMMGVCFDCLIEVDGHPNVQSCMITVRDGMVLRRQIGLRSIDGHSVDE